MIQSVPIYTLLADKWIDGQPDNNDFFGLKYEWDFTETQLRAGGDAQGLMDARGLDYLQSMGYKGIYIAGTIFVNMPWQADGEPIRIGLWVPLTEHQDIRPWISVQSILIMGPFRTG